MVDVVKTCKINDSIVIEIWKDGFKYLVPFTDWKSDEPTSSKVFDNYEDALKQFTYLLLLETN